MLYTIYFQRKVTGEWCRDWTTEKPELAYYLLKGWAETNHRTILIVS